MTEVLLLKIIHFLEMININEIPDPIVLLIDHTDHLTDAIFVLDTDHVLNTVTTILRIILFHIDLLRGQEILDVLDPALTPIQEITLICPNPINK